MNKSKNFFREGLLVYILANSLDKVPFQMKIIINIAFILYCIIRIAKSIKKKSLNIEVYAIVSIMIFGAYNLAGTIVENCYQNYRYFFNSNISIVIRVLLAIITVVLLGFYGYSCVDENDKETWLRSLKIISTICLIILVIIGMISVL